MLRSSRIRRGAGVAVALLATVFMSACAIGRPQPTSYVSDRGATLNGDINSNVAGDIGFWWKYGETTSYGSQTPVRTISIDDDQPHAVSQPISELTAATTYHFQFCVQDREQRPPRDICSKDQTFATGPAGGRAGIAFRSSRDGNLEIYVMDADGSNPVRLTNEPASDEQPAWSPDGRRLAFTSLRDGNWEVHAMDADGGNQTNMTNSPGQDLHPAWSPDGQKIAFHSNRNGNNNEIYVMDADGSHLENLTNGVANDTDAAWSPDGRRIAFGAGSDVHVMDADGSNRINLTNTPSGDGNPAWSPDGERISFTTDRDGLLEVYAMDADGSNQTNLSNDSANDLGSSYSPDGERIAFGATRDGNVEVYAMDADGSNQTNLTNTAGTDAYAAWSPRPGPALYVAMGDSVTQWGATDRYPELFMNFLEQAGVAQIGPPAYNLGRLGETSAGLNGGQLPLTLDYIGEPASDAGVVTVDIGANDLFNDPTCDPRALATFNLESCQPTLQAFETNFAATLDAVNEAFADDPGDERLIVMAYYNPWSGRAAEEARAAQAERVLLGADRTIDCDATGTDRGLNDLIACTAAEAGARVADAYPPFLDNGDLWLSDDIHPNELGHEAIADAFEGAFTAP